MTQETIALMSACDLSLPSAAEILAHTPSKLIGAG
jgi:hypothetical protein